MWKMSAYRLESIHFPAVAEPRTPPGTLNTPSARWKFTHADWSVFQEKTVGASMSVNEVNIDDATNLLANLVFMQPRHSIP